MESLHCEPCQIQGVKTKPFKEAEALEEHLLPSETWSNNSNKATGPGPVHSSDVVVEDSAISVPFSETLLGLIVKMPASLQPVCCGGSSVLLPVEVQLAGEVEPQTSVITPPPGCLKLPLIIDQTQVQYLSPLSSGEIKEHTQNLPQSLLQKNGLSQNLSLTMGQSQCCEGKSENTSMYSSEFLSSVQQLIPFLRNYSSSPCRGSSSFPLNIFGASFIPPDSTLSHLYAGSPPVSLLPPATLLVPFPFVVPLPVPLPIPIPIPFPIPFIPDSGCLSRASHTIKTTKSTQTEDISVCTHNRMSGYDFLQLPTQLLPPVSQEEVLDLTVKVVPVQTKREIQFHQDHVLDLSVANKSRFDTKLNHHGRNSRNVDSTKPIQPMKCSPTQATSQSNHYSDREISMHYKRTTEKRYASYGLKYSDQNGSVMTPKHIPRVTQSTKDAAVRLCEQIVWSPQGQVLQKRIDKKKRDNTQNINIFPIKKQHLMTVRPSK